MSLKMRFGDFVWPVNPEKIKTVNETQFSSTLLPFSTAFSEPTVLKPRRVTGSGSFNKETSLFYIEKLRILQKNCQAMMLVLPTAEEFECVLSSLSVYLNEDMSVDYEFEFVEADTSKDSFVASGSTDVIGGETVYEICERTGITLQRLLALNPEIKDPYVIEQGSVLI